jgi:polyphenol oxidase
MPRVVFSSRHGGVSNGAYDSLNLGDHVGDSLESVTANREILRKSLSLSELVFMNQSHSSDISFITEGANPKKTPNADALMTNLRGIGLAVMVADCVPLLLASEAWVAAVHVGRVGLLDGIVEKVLTSFESHNATPTRAWIGPHICADCYEVSPEMYQSAITERPQLATNGASHCLNLAGEIRAVLNQANVAITDIHTCAAESSDYFSYRRDGVTGRFAGVISL